MTPGSRSGGKIEKQRRWPTTPYDRPDALSNPTRSSGWLGGFVLPATRKIASGAGNLILSVFGSDGSSSSDSDPTSDDEVEETESDEIEIDFEEAVELNKECSVTSQNPKCLSCEKLPDVQSDMKHHIEHLLMQETFTWEESECLIKIINERTVDARPAVGEDVLEVHKKAVMEAKKWLEAKRSESCSNAAGSLMMVPFQQHQPSPVDIAKSYMHGRSLTSTSPLPNPDFHTPSPEVRGRGGRGSWNIQEEIRKVRVRVTENMLKHRQQTPPKKDDGDDDDEGKGKPHDDHDTHVEVVSCGFLSEASMEIPTVGEDNGTAPVDGDGDLRSPEDEVVTGRVEQDTDTKHQQLPRRKLTRNRKK